MRRSIRPARGSSSYGLQPHKSPVSSSLVEMLVSPIELSCHRDVLLPEFERIHAMGASDLPLVALYCQIGSRLISNLGGMFGIMIVKFTTYVGIPTLSHFKLF